MSAIKIKVDTMLYPSNEQSNELPWHTDTTCSVQMWVVLFGKMWFPATFWLVCRSKQSTYLHDKHHLHGRIILCQFVSKWNSTTRTNDHLWSNHIEHLLLNTSILQYFNTPKPKILLMYCIVVYQTSLMYTKVLLCNKNVFKKILKHKRWWLATNK